MSPLFAARAFDVNGQHVRVQFRAGVPGQRALLGELTMTPSEWVALRSIIGDHMEVTEP